MQSRLMAILYLCSVKLFGPINLVPLVHQKMVKFLKSKSSLFKPLARDCYIYTCMLH